LVGSGNVFSIVPHADADDADAAAESIVEMIL
jgi:hypothetical protein